MKRKIIQITEEFINIPYKEKFNQDKEKKIETSTSRIKKYQEEIDKNRERLEKATYGSRFIESYNQTIKIEENKILMQEKIIADINEKEKEYKIPVRASEFTIDITNTIFNLKNYYSIYLSDNNSLNEISGFGWEYSIYKNKIHILAKSNRTPHVECFGASYSDGIGGVKLRSQEIDNPIGKDIVIFYEDFFL